MAVLGSFTVLCLAIAQPRSAFTRLARQPGIVLSLTIVTVAALTAAVKGAFPAPLDDWEETVWRVIVFGVITNVGYAVICLLILLKMTGHYRRAQSTADAVGRGLAWLWIILLVLERGRWLLERAQIV
jgi:hypothetical protein